MLSFRRDDGVMPVVLRTSLYYVASQVLKVGLLGVGARARLVLCHVH